MVRQFRFQPGALLIIVGRGRALDRRVIVGDRRLVITDAAVEGGAVHIIIRFFGVVVDRLLIGGEQRGEALVLAGTGDFLVARGVARGRAHAELAFLRSEERRVGTGCV